MRITTGRISALLTGVAAVVLTSTAAVAGGPAAGPVLGDSAAGAIGDRYIVVLQPDATGAGLTQRYGGQVVDRYRTAVRGFSARMTPGQARRLAADPAVEYVEQDATVALADAAPEVPAWGLDRIDQRTRPLSESYTAPSAAGVTAYVLDTGIRISHQEFGGRASNGYDWVTAHAHRPAVANLSLGGTRSKALDDAINRSIAAGVTYAVAAGNNNRDACRQSPADDPAAITVGATDNTDRRAPFSNYGSCLDLFAPGVRIRSASNQSNVATMLMSGTSMASPHVAGAAALVLGAHPGWTPAQVRDELVAQADPAAVTSAGRGSTTKLLYTGFLNTALGATSHR